jgi:hypothetical protein
MSRCTVVSAILTVVVCCLAADQDILTILKRQNGISTFTGLLEPFPDLIAILNQETCSGMLIRICSAKKQD